MKFFLITFAFLAGQLNAAPVAADSNMLETVREATEGASHPHFRGGDADQAYHTITPHDKDKFRGDDADQAYHTITPHHRDHFRGNDADQVYHTITPHHEDKFRGDDADQAYHTITPHDE